MLKNSLQWFKDRVGKRVYRTESSCQCDICKKIGEVGLVISDELHSQYLFDCQNELDLYYFDKPISIEYLDSLIDFSNKLVKNKFCSHFEDGFPIIHSIKDGDGIFIKEGYGELKDGSKVSLNINTLDWDIIDNI